MSAVVPLKFSRPSHAEKRFVDEHRGLECLVMGMAYKNFPGLDPEFLVKLSGESVEGTVIFLMPRRFLGTPLVHNRFFPPFPGSL